MPGALLRERPEWRPIRRRFWRYFIPLATAIVAISIALHLTRWMDAHSRLDRVQRSVVAIVSEHVREALRQVTTDVRFLSRIGELRVLLDENSPPNREQLRREFAAFLSGRHGYLEACLHGLDGAQLLRVDGPGLEDFDVGSMHGGASYRLAVEAAVAAGPGTVIVSSPEVPSGSAGQSPGPRSVLTFFTVVPGGDNAVRGVLVLSFTADHLEDQLSNLASLALGSLAVVDRSGAWFVGPAVNSEVPRSAGVDASFATEHSAAWRVVAERRAGHVNVDSTAYEFARIEATSFGASEPRAGALPEMSLMVVALAPSQGAMSGWQTTLLLSVAALVAVAFVILAGAWLWQRAATSEDASIHDPLTNLHNRLGYEREVKSTLAEVARRGLVASLMVCDVDHFKDVNDTHGHDVGDTIIKGVAQSLVARLRKRDFIARLGGDEFVVIFRNTDLEEARLAVEHFRQSLARTRLGHGDVDILVTVSVGLALFRPDDDPRSVFARADQALYAAKHTGRNRVCTESEGSEHDRSVG